MSHEPDRNRRLLRSCLGLSGPVEPSDTDIGEWIHEATRLRVVPLLFELVSSSSVEATNRLAEFVRSAQLDIMRQMVQLEHDLLMVADAFAARGIHFAVLKGLATAHLDYFAPELRQCSDVDLLVSPTELDAARETLNGLGWEQAYALPRHHQSFAHAITFRNGQRSEVDLHQRLAHRAVGCFVPTDELLGAARRYEIAGSQLWALSDVDRIIHAALHAVLSRGPYAHLSSVADVLVLTASRSTLAGQTVERSERWKVGNLVERAIRSSYERIGESVPLEWERTLDRPRTSQSWLVDHAYLGPRRRPASEELAHLLALPGWSERSRYLAGYLATDPDYADQHGRHNLRMQTRYLASRLRSRDV